MPIATLEDIAEEAKVSVTTVSRVINRKDAEIRISSSTRDRVLGIADRVRYRPNTFAKALKTKKSNTIGITLSDIRDPFFAEIIHGIEQAIKQRGYHVILSSEDNPEDEIGYLEVFQDKVDGFIIMGGETFADRDKEIAAFKKQGHHLVLVDREVEGEDIPCFLTDNVKGGQIGTEHLIDLGHRRLAYIKGPERKIDCRDRFRGFRKTLNERGVEYEERLIREADLSRETSYQTMRDLLQMSDIPTGVFAFNDTAAFGVIQAIVEQKLRVPEDIAVVGYDDIAAAGNYNPPLTTVRQLRHEMGRDAATALFDLIEGRELSSYKNVYEPKLVIRKSCGGAIGGK